MKSAISARFGYCVAYDLLPSAQVLWRAGGLTI